MLLYSCELVPVTISVKLNVPLIAVLFDEIIKLFVNADLLLKIADEGVAVICVLIIPLRVI